MKNFICTVGTIVAAAMIAIFAVAFIRQAVPADSEHWKIKAEITTANEVVALTYGSQATGPIWFSSEQACNDTLKGKDEQFKKIKAKVDAEVKKRNDKVTWSCVLDLHVPADSI